MDREMLALRALELAQSPNSSEDDIVYRAQAYFDWLVKVTTIPSGAVKAA